MCWCVGRTTTSQTVALKTLSPVARANATNFSFSHTETTARLFSRARAIRLTSRLVQPTEAQISCTAKAEIDLSWLTTSPAGSAALTFSCFFHIPRLTIGELPV